VLQVEAEAEKTVLARHLLERYCKMQVFSGRINDLVKSSGSMYVRNENSPGIHPYLLREA
jgi:hypothetical protein